jgi:hypothetical protein
VRIGDIIDNAGAPRVAIYRAPDRAPRVRSSGGAGAGALRASVIGVEPGGRGNLPSRGRPAARRDIELQSRAR